MLPGHNLTQYQHSLETVWLLQQFLEGKNALLQVVSIPDPDAMPETLFTDSLDKVELKGYSKPMIGYFEARGELIGASLVGLINQTETKKQLQMHRLVQEVVLSNMDVRRRLEVFEAALRLVSFP